MEKGMLVEIVGEATKPKNSLMLSACCHRKTKKMFQIIMKYKMTTFCLLHFDEKELLCCP